MNLAGYDLMAPGNHEFDYGTETFMSKVDAADFPMVAATGTDEDKSLPVVGVENGGGIRDAWHNGAITRGNIMTSFPFSNTLCVKKVTPAILYQLLEASTSSMSSQDPQTGTLIQSSISGGFLQVSGITVVCDPTAAERAGHPSGRGGERWR